MTSYIQDTQRKQLLARLRDAVLRAGTADAATIPLVDLDAAIVLVEIAIEGSRLEGELEDARDEAADLRDEKERLENALAEAQERANYGGAR